MSEVSFAMTVIKKNIQSSAELRTSFLTNVIGMAINNTAFIILWVFFVQSVGIINGWTAADIVGLQGFTALSFGIIFSVAAGIRRLPESIATGEFDRFMLSPKNVLLRAATSSFGVSAIGDVIFGVICLVLYGLFIHASLGQFILGALLAIISTFIFLSASIIVHSIGFFFIDAESVARGLFELFLTPALFHGGAFQGFLRFFYIFLIPSLIVGALPVEIIRDVTLVPLLYIIPLSIGWFLIALFVFHRGMRRYESANFMTFGS